MLGISKYTKRKAEEILGLPANYTDEDRKKAYRNAIKRYADGLRTTEENEASEKIREINEANAVLTGKTSPAFDSSSFDWADFTDSIMKNREELVKKLRKRNSKIDKNCASYFRKISKEFSNIITDYEFCIYLGSRSSSALYAEAEEKLNNKLKELETIFLNENGITKEEFGEIDYTLSIRDFFDELLRKVKEKNYSFGKIGVFKERLLMESKKYVDLYSHLQDTVNVFIEEQLKSSIIEGKIGNLEEEEKIINLFHGKIKGTLLKKVQEAMQKEKDNFCNYGYSFLSTKMDEIISLLLDNFKDNFDIDSLDNLIIDFKNQVDKLIKEYCNSLSLIEKLNDLVGTIELLIGETEETAQFSSRISALDKSLKQGMDISNDLCDLNININGYYAKVERKIDLANNEMIKSSYAEFERKYHEKMQSLNPIKDINTIKMMNELLSEVINLFNSLIIGVIDAKEFLDCINATNFDDIPEAISKIKECSLGKSFIYINMKDTSKFGPAGRFYLLKEEGGKLFMYYKVQRDYQPDCLRRIEVTPEEVRENFESIESLLNRSDYIGRLLNKDYFTSTYVLYVCPELTIRRINDNGKNSYKFRIVTRNNRVNNSNRRFEVDENAGFSDRRELIAEIKNRLEKMYTAEKQKKSNQKRYYNY